MNILALLWKFREWIMLALLILGGVGYWFGLKHTINKDNTIILQLTQEKADLSSKLDFQNQAVDRMKLYADQQARKVADAQALSEKMQDTVDAQANEILLRQTNIDQQINTLSDCQNELGRIKAFLVNAEGAFRENK